MTRLIGSKTLNILLFNLLWVGCVAGRESLIWATAPITLLYVALLLNHTAVSIQQLAVPTVIGITVDSLLRITGIFEFPPTSLPVPLWLMTLWLIFATTVPLSLEIIHRHRAMTVLAGALGFPFSYAMGEHLGAVTFGVGYLETLVFLSLLWAAGLPVFFYLSKKLSLLSHATNE